MIWGRKKQKKEYKYILKLGEGGNSQLFPTKRNCKGKGLHSETPYIHQERQGYKWWKSTFILELQPLSFPPGSVSCGLSNCRGLKKRRGYEEEEEEERGKGQANFSTTQTGQK
uniref:Uncharacterized protein n=1 Tax=Micrurus carvalhoi TaxID=3147026 RepID=A0A2H6N0V6_9SAUR